MIYANEMEIAVHVIHDVLNLFKCYRIALFLVMIIWQFLFTFDADIHMK